MKKRVLLFILALSVLLFSVAMTAGTELDPLVSRSWVEKYVKEQMEPLEKRIAELEAQLGKETKVYFQIGKKEVKSGDETFTADVAPQLINGNTYVPFRVLGDCIGAKVGFDNADKKATFTKGSSEVAVWIGKNQVSVGGKVTPVSIGAVMVDNRTMVPLRIISENFGYKVTWDNQTKTAEIIVK